MFREMAISQCSRERMLTAALQIIEVEGIAGVSYRKVASAGNVSVGAISYHFSTLDDLLYEALAGFVESAETYYGPYIGQAMSEDDLRLALLKVLVACMKVESRQGPSRVLLELHAYAARNTEVGYLVERWAQRNREFLQRYLGCFRAALITTLFQGLVIESAGRTASRKLADSERMLDVLLKA